MEKLFSVKNLGLRFSPSQKNPDGVSVLRDVSYSVDSGKVLAIVGESGCGKTVSLLAAMGLLPEGVELKGEVTFDDQPLLHLDTKAINRIRGHEMSMIFQDPMTALNPTMTVGKQIAEVLIVHKQMSAKDALRAAINLLEKLGVAEAKLRANQFPFEFSGGMLQRAAIAIAIATEPKLILADEPTTALDATIQKQVLLLIKKLQREQGSALILVTHDLSVVVEMADDIVIMYAGQVVERGSLSEVFNHPAHPYTCGLKGAQPVVERESLNKTALNKVKQARLIPIEGAPPDLSQEISGCAFKYRCPKVMNICDVQEPPELVVDQTHLVKCWRYHENYLNSGQDL